MFDFIADLDEYFCEKYADYDKICILPGYRMPKMQTSEVREDGRTYAYTLPANTMRLALQENKAQLLAAIKEQAYDKTFSFSFRPLRLFGKLKNAFSSKGFLKNFRATLAKYNLSPEEAGAELSVPREVWRGICKGWYLPTKNLVLSLALTAHMNIDDTNDLLFLCGYALDYAVVKDVVIAYLLEQKVFNRDMAERALAEYKVRNLFIKGTEEEKITEKGA